MAVVTFQQKARAMNNLLINRRLRLARAIKAKLNNLPKETALSAIAHNEFLSWNEMNLGNIAFAWWRDTFPFDSYTNANPVASSDDAERLFALNIAEAYLEALKFHIEQEKLTAIDVPEPMYESGYVGVLGSVYLTLVKVVKKQLVNGLYGQSTLITFHDKYSNVIKTFAKPMFVAKIEVGTFYLLKGIVSKHHTFSGEKETILRNAEVETDIPTGVMQTWSTTSSMSLMTEI